MVGQVMDLGVAVMAGCDAVSGACLDNLIEFEFAVLVPFFIEARLQITASAAAAIIVRFVGHHIDKIFFADAGFNDKAQIVGIVIAILLAHLIAGILDGEAHLEIPVPDTARAEPAFSYSLGIKVHDHLDVEPGVDIKPTDS